MSDAKPHLPDAQTVTAVTHWTDRLFSFRVTRPRSLRFRSGEFVMIGLMGDTGKPLLRAYSIASPAWDEELEFYSIKVPDGPLTSRLQHIQVGDEIILRPKPVGTLVHDALLPGKRIYFLSTGTGFAQPNTGAPVSLSRPGRMIVPNGSTWRSGLRLSRLALAAVGSPNARAIQPCATSWKTIARIIGIATVAMGQIMPSGFIASPR